MTVEHVAARVVAVLTRAESLFATPGDAAAVEAAGRMGEAAEASRAIVSRTAELSGAVASAHRNVLAVAAQRLEDAAGTDGRLADHVADTSATHGAGRSRATELRAGAAEVSARLGPWAELPASELAALKALRNRLSGMQHLLAQHSAEATRVAAEIRTLGYQQ
jgi:hypothetical protein